MDLQGSGFDKSCCWGHLHITGVESLDGQTPWPHHKLLVLLPPQGTWPAPIHRVVDSETQWQYVITEDVNQRDTKFEQLTAFFYFWFTVCYNSCKVIWNDLNYDRNGCKQGGGLWNTMTVICFKQRCWPNRHKTLIADWVLLLILVCYNRCKNCWSLQH